MTLKVFLIGIGVCGLPAALAAQETTLADQIAQEVDAAVDAKAAKRELEAAGDELADIRSLLEGRGFAKDEIDVLLTAATAFKTAADRKPSEIDPSVLSVLNGEQLASVLVAQEEARRARYMRDSEPPGVAIVVPIASFLFILGIIWVALFMRNRSLLERQKTLRMMVEQGAEIPPGLIAVPEKPKSDLRRGLILVCTSIGVAAFLFVVDEEHKAWSLSLIPFMIGVGYFLAHRVEEGAKDLP